MISQVIKPNYKLNRSQVKVADDSENNIAVGSSDS